MYLFYILTTVPLPPVVLPTPMYCFLVALLQYLTKPNLKYQFCLLKVQIEPPRFALFCFPGGKQHFIQCSFHLMATGSETFLYLSSVMCCCLCLGYLGGRIPLWLRTQVRIGAVIQAPAQRGLAYVLCLWVLGHICRRELAQGLTYNLFA